MPFAPKRNELLEEYYFNSEEEEGITPNRELPGVSLPEESKTAEKGPQEESKGENDPQE